MKHPPTSWALDPLERVHLTFSAGGVAVAATFASPLFALSYGLGVALEAVNFRALRSSATRLFAGELGGAGLWVALLGMRLVFLLASVGMALLAGAHPVGLLLGVSTVVPALLFGAWWLGPAVDPRAPSLPPEDPAWEGWSVWRADARPPAAADEPEDHAS